MGCNIVKVLRTTVNISTHSVLPLTVGGAFKLECLNNAPSHKNPLSAEKCRHSSFVSDFRESDLLKDGVSSNPNPEEQDLMREEAQKMSSVQPTMWLGAQNGW